MDSDTCRGGSTLKGVCTVLVFGLCALLALPVQGQFRSVLSAERLETGQVTHLYASWEGAETIHGVILELPAGWALRRAVALRHGYDAVPVEVRPAEGNRYVLTTGRPVQSAYDFVFTVETGSGPGPASWGLVPFVQQGARPMFALEGFRETHRVELAFPETVPENRVLGFDGDERAPLLLRAQSLPDLGLREPFTLAFWMKTNRLGEVVLSTWDGDEQTPYPIEMVVDAGGRLLYYRGRPGQHESMTSGRPVADGQWHHVALSNDPRTGWARLFLDGRPVDSLYSATPLDIGLEASVALGGRVPSAYERGGTLGPFTGQLDELHLWPRVRSAASLRRGMRQPIGPSNTERPRQDGVHLGFEDDVPTALIARRSARARRTASDLSFFQPLRNLRAVVEAPSIVRLTWEAVDEQATAFVVERSGDGRRFDEVARLTRTDAEDGDFFRFRDREAAGQILFYRVRQRYPGGDERLSATIKLGMGQDEQEEPVQLIGNFPNPFNTGTTVTYEVREAQPIRVSVWDLSGQQVAQLVDQTQQPGIHEVPFEAADLPSGTYFVRLEVRGRIQTHKMILMK